MKKWNREILFVSMKTHLLDDIFRVFIVILSSVIYSFGIIWFLEPANLYAGGINGLAQLVSRIIGIATGKPLNIGFLIFVMNVPILIVAWRMVSKKFAMYSLLSIVVQSIFTSGIIPDVDFNLDLLSLALLGGLVTGFGGALALRYGTSTGGIDMIAQALAFKKNVTIGSSTLIFNVLVAIVGGGIVQGDWIITLYTFIRIILTSIVTDKVHTAYNYLSLNIITVSGYEIASVLMQELHRGCTLFKGEGAYTHSNKQDIYSVVSSYEVDRVIKICKSIDPNVFVVISPVKRLFGNFKRKSIV